MNSGNVTKSPAESYFMGSFEIVASNVKFVEILKWRFPCTIYYSFHRECCQREWCMLHDRTVGHCMYVSYMTQCYKLCVFGSKMNALYSPIYRKDVEQTQFRHKRNNWNKESHLESDVQAEPHHKCESIHISIFHAFFCSRKTHVYFCTNILRRHSSSSRELEQVSQKNGLHLIFWAYNSYPLKRS